jgi:protein involved in polysaccharide export with SLBB domain
MLLLFAVTAHAQNSSSIPGEFQVGDQIVLTVDAPDSKASFSDTLRVRDGLVVTLKRFGDIPLQGVRRADAKEYMTKAVAKYIKNATVNATVLISVGIFGAVARPAYFPISTDMAFRDVISLAGFGPTADPTKVVVKRQDKTVMSEKETREALASGKTVNDLPIRANDMLQVGEKSHTNWGVITQFVGLGLGVVTLVISLMARN